MDKTYGYDPLSYALIELFTSGAPDFAAAKELIRQGADVNAQGDDRSENVLSEILLGYWQSGIDSSKEECQDCDTDYEQCRSCKNHANPNVGISMTEIIQFFLDHGFDVTRNRGKYGAQCLSALALSSFDKEIIRATKMLLNAGAQNIPVEDGEPEETPMTAIGAEGSYQDTSEGNHYLGNIYEAVYQIYVALEEGRSYLGIDSFEAAIDKKVLRVMAVGDHADSVFTSVDLPTSKHENCFYHNLYMIFDGGCLVCAKDASYWVDTAPIDKNLVDVSHFFSPIVGHTLRQVTFGHKSIRKGITVYGQPMTSFHFDNGIKLTFSINFGEVENEEYCSYFTYEA